MFFIKFVGVFSAIFGLMLLFTPKLLLRLNNSVNKMLLDVDSELYKMRIGMGISLCMVSVTMFFIVYYMMQKFGMK